MENPLCDDDHFAATQCVDDRVLKDVVAYVEVRTTNDNRSEAVRRELQQLGATVVKKFTNDVTHVVFKEGSNRTKTKALKKGVHFVSILWVDCCKQNQEHVSERMYPAIVPKHKGPNLFIAKLKKAKSMQPRDFEEEVSRSAERVSRKKRRIEALDRLQSAGNTPYSSPRSPLVLVQDTQPRSPEEGFGLTPVRLTIPDTPPSMREKMKQLKIGREGSYNEVVADGRKFSSVDFMFDKEPLQRKLFMSSGVTFDTLPSFDSPGANSVFTSEDDTKDTTGNTSQLSDDDNTEVDCDDESPVPTDKAKTVENKYKAIDVKFSPIAEDKNEDSDVNISQVVGGESDSSVTEDILNIAGKINATMNKQKTALDDSVTLDSDDNFGNLGIKVQQTSLDKVIQKTLDNKSESPSCTENNKNGVKHRSQSSSRNSVDNCHENKATHLADKRNHKSEVTFAKKNTRRKSRRISLQEAINQIHNADVDESCNGEDSATSVSVATKQVTIDQIAAEHEQSEAVSSKETKVRRKTVPKKGSLKEKKVEKETELETVLSKETEGKKPSEHGKETQAEFTTCNLISEVNNKDESDNANQEMDRKSVKSKVDRRRTETGVENRTLKNKSMPKKKLLSLTDLNEPHSVLIEPNKCSDVQRPELVDSKPKCKRSRKKKEDLKSVSDDGIADDNSKVRKRCSDSAIISDKERDQKRKSEQNSTDIVDDLNNHNTNETQDNKGKTGRKRKSKLCNNSDKLINDNAVTRNQEGEQTTEIKSRGRKRTSKHINKSAVGSKGSPKQPKRDSIANQSKSERPGKQLVRVNDTIMRDKEEPDISSSVRSQLHDITTQLNLTANNSVTASLRDGTLSLSMSTIYNTDTTMQSFSVSQTQRKSIDEFSLSQKNRSKEKTKALLTTMKEDRKNVRKSSSDSDNSVSGRSRKKYRPSLVMTSLHLHEQDVVISVVKKLGGFVIAENVNETTTHVICGEPRRTLNILQCVARGAWLLNKAWVIKSLEAGAWIQEEEFECNQFFPVCKVARLERESSTAYYKQQLFSNVGPIYVSGRSLPPRLQLVQLIKLCGGQVTGVLNKASVYVGSDLHPDLTCLKTQWILECITQHRLLPMERFSLDRPKREASPVY